MKVTVDIECTPEEARSFMGLPDVRPLQESMLKEMEQRLKLNMEAMSPEAMFKSWFSAGHQGAENMQKMFLSHMQNMMAAAGIDKKRAE